MDTNLKEYLLSYSLEGIIVTDMEGNILDFNNTACKLLGYPGSELEEQFIDYIFPHQSTPHLLPNLLHLARTAGFDGDIILEDSTGGSIMVRMIAQAWPQASPSYLLLRFLDWSETHRIMTQLRDSNQMAALGTLTRSLSHEIRNPVAIIGGHTKRLLDSMQTGSEEEEWARQVMSGVERLESMVETIETFLHLPPPSFKKNSMGKLLDSSLEGIRPEAENKGVIISMEKVPKTPQIFMDPDLLEKAFSAIWLNAMDRMAKGGELSLVMNHDSRYCRITVTDSGPSMDTRQMEEDLSPLHVIGAHQTHLNLAIARRIVDEHGGRFELATPSGKGLEVRISLPRDRRALAREREM